MKATFADFELTKQLSSALEKLNITTPTPIQEKSFKPILSGRDIMGIAQTGTGKTLAYLLPLLNTYQYSKTNQPKIVILVPTRELVVQVTDILFMIYSSRFVISKVPALSAVLYASSPSA